MAFTSLTPALAPRRGGWSPAWVRGLGRSFAVLLVPGSLPGLVRTQRAGRVLVAIALLGFVAAFISGPSLDVRSQVEVEETIGGQVVPLSELEYAENLAKRQKLAQLKLVLGWAVTTPLAILVLGVALGMLARFIGGRPAPGATLSLAAHASLPGLVLVLLSAIACRAGPPVAPERLATLVPPGLLASHAGGVLARALGEMTLFSWWTILLLGVGFPAASGARRGPALLAFVVATLLYLAVTNLILGPR